MITFTSETSGKQLGTADLKNGKLTASNDMLQQVIDTMSATRGLDAKRAHEFFSDWSNGYVTSKAGKVASEGSKQDWSTHKKD